MIPFLTLAFSEQILLVIISIPSRARKPLSHDKRYEVLGLKSLKYVQEFERRECGGTVERKIVLPNISVGSKILCSKRSSEAWYIFGAASEKNEGMELILQESIHAQEAETKGDIGTVIIDM